MTRTFDSDYPHDRADIRPRGVPVGVGLTIVKPGFVWLSVGSSMDAIGYFSPDRAQEIGLHLILEAGRARQQQTQQQKAEMARVVKPSVTLTTAGGWTYNDGYYTDA